MPILVPSKINLYLKVTGRRADGYHELSTLFLPLAEPHDVIDLKFNPGGGLRVTSNSAAIPADADNLAGKAALLYANEAHLPPDWHLHIVKNIPVAAGMGGGSTDAAGVLRLLNDHYGCFKRQRLREMALRLGADVPFFITPAPTWSDGIGETVVRTLAPPVHLPLLLIEPGFPVSARWAYEHLTPEAIGPGAPEAPERLDAALAAEDWAEAARWLHNDLEAALWTKFPLLEMLREFAQTHGALAVHVSGSGPTLYALFAAPEALRTAQEAGRAAFPEVNFRVAAVWRQMGGYDN